MKKFISTFAAFIVLVTTAAAQSVIKFDTSSHNFGKFEEDKVQTAVFNYTNTGNEPLVIQQVMTSCGCTVPSYTKTPVKPGEKGQIKISYNGRGKSAGYFKKMITVRTNASNGIVRIHIEGEMIKN